MSNWCPLTGLEHLTMAEFRGLWCTIEGMVTDPTITFFTKSEEGVVIWNLVLDRIRMEKELARMEQIYYNLRSLPCKDRAEELRDELKEIYLWLYR